MSPTFLMKLKSLNRGCVSSFMMIICSVDCSSGGFWFVYGWFLSFLLISDGKFYQKKIKILNGLIASFFLSFTSEFISYEYWFEFRSLFPCLFACNCLLKALT